MPPSSLLTLLEIWQVQLKAWAIDGAITQAAGSALSLEGSQPLLQELESAWVAGDFSRLPPFELLFSSSMTGAASLYETSTGTIYINQNRLATDDEDQIQGTLIEELGHFFDDNLNTVDTEREGGWPR